MKILLYFSFTFELKFYLTLKSEILGEHESASFYASTKCELLREHEVRAFIGGLGAKPPASKNFSMKRPKRSNFEVCNW